MLAAVLGLDRAAAAWGSFNPALINGSDGATQVAVILLTPLTATLLHAGFVHLLFNILFLLFCGRSVEAIIGGRQLVLLYVVSAYVAAAAHYLTHLQSQAGAIGASGAISGVIGAYSVLFGRNRVKVADPTLAFWLNALWLATTWVVLQALIGLASQVAMQPISAAAHIGGFLVGLVLAKPLLMLRYRGA